MVCSLISYQLADDKNRAKSEEAFFADPGHASVRGSSHSSGKKAPIRIKTKNRLPRAMPNLFQLVNVSFLS